MIEAHITVPKNIWIDAQRYSFRYLALINLMSFYAWRLFIVWLVIAVVDGIANQGPLISEHFKALFALWVITCIIGYINWYLRLNETASSYSFHAKLKDDGVYANYPEVFIPWDTYHSIVDRGNYYLIKGENGISAIPKNDELEEVIQFSLKNIPNK